MYDLDLTVFPYTSLCKIDDPVVGPILTLINKIIRMCALKKGSQAVKWPSQVLNMYVRHTVKCA